MKGQEALILTMNTGVGAAQPKLIEAAAKANVSWTLPNDYGPDVIGRHDMGKVSQISSKR